MMNAQRYRLNFIIHTYNVKLGMIKSSLAEFAEAIEVSGIGSPSGKGESFSVTLSTEDPTIIFDVCSQFGRIRSVKVEDEGG
jgi:hypothetical protein